MQTHANKGQKHDIYPIIKKIIAELWDNEDSLEFRQPVDYKALNLQDYPLLIKTPMDLSTVKKKIRTKKYKNYTEFTADVNLIWENCIKYNQEGSQIFKIATKMEKFAKKVFKKYINQKQHNHQGVGGSNGGGGGSGSHTHHQTKKESYTNINPNILYQQQFMIPQEQQMYYAPNNQPQMETIKFEDKVQFCQKIKGLNQNELIQIIKIIDENSPQSILDVTKDKFKIKIDDLNLQSFGKIEEYIDTLQKQQKLI